MLVREIPKDYNVIPHFSPTIFSSLLSSDAVPALFAPEYSIMRDL